MMVYIGQTRSRSLIWTLSHFGLGEMTVREEVPPRRRPWAFDNGAFKDWRAGKPFDEVRYLRAVERAHDADFVVTPDIVGGGGQSLEFSLQWQQRLKGFRQYLVVQEGMTVETVRPHVESFAGIFVGGATLEWKLATARDWIELAHQHHRKCHVGRVGTGDRLRLMRRLKADSVDSALPLFSFDNFRRFMRGFYDVNEEVLSELSGC